LLQELNYVRFFNILNGQALSLHPPAELARSPDVQADALVAISLCTQRGAELINIWSERPNPVPLGYPGI
jgi:hypothetical protein